jgi:hypothetical protein
MSMIGRRHFVQRAGAFALGFSGLRAWGAAAGSTHVLDALEDGYGPLVIDPEGVIDLPAGFSYAIISRAGDVMSDGLIAPSKPDGMAAFPGADGLTVIVRNHELTRSHSSDGPFGPGQELLDRVDMSLLYDQGTSPRPSRGGTTTLVYDTGRRLLVKSFLSLAGTEVNCAGGPTPRNTWLSCEETVVRAGRGYGADHGYVFEVPATVDSGLVRAEPIRGMGRFKHEAVAVDPASGCVYLTEDRHDSCLYRFLPNVPERLLEGGRLQALAIGGRPSLDTRNWGTSRDVEIGERLPLDWIDLNDVEPADDSLRDQAYERGAARFARGEGMWRGCNEIYFACTIGGNRRLGQIWRLRASARTGAANERSEPGMLELFVEPNNATVVENADNITVSPWGDLIVCEDGPGQQFLLGVTPAGQIYKLARNALNGSELAGATFSPDASTLFVNIQHPHGFTLAINGPWKRA